MSLFTQIVCPHCSQHLKIAGATAGKQVRCPQCQGYLRVPDVSPAGSAPLWQLRTETGKIYGPVPREELAQWVREGRVQAQCQVSPVDTPQWMWAAELFPELAENAAMQATGRPPAFDHPQRVSDRSRLIAGLLGLLLPLVGLNGVHRLYTGHIGLGILMLITCGGCGIWQLIDVILVFAGAVRDVDGLPLRS
jgi:TM2 domain-containing membrane protein YozV